MIQVVCVKWGTKYGTDPVNRLYRAILRNTQSAIRFICVTDRPDDDFDHGIVTRPFPAFSAPREVVAGGCRLKIAIFARGILEDGLPTVYVDLDTMIRGDVARLTAELERHPGMFMLQNHFIPWWPFARFVRLFAPEKYYFGNSSLLAFHPEKFHFIFDDFNRAMSPLPNPMPKHLKTDERYISFAARDDVRVFPRRLAVKFAEEYMAPVLGIEDVRKRLPWVIARRRSVVAITFVGMAFKPKQLAAMEKGQVVRYRHLTHRWDHDDFRDYWLGSV